MMLLICSVLLQIMFVNGRFVDITLHNNNFTGIISLTYDGYFGLFSKLSGAVSPVCKFSYVFGMGSLNVSSTTCSDLNITEYGDAFECGAVDSTFFECQRMGRNSLCDNNKSWTVLYTNITSCKPCAGICSVNIDETISINYQENITTVPESTCSRPTYAYTTTDYTTFYTTNAISVAADATSTVSADSSALSSQTPLIIGLCVSNGIWAFTFICVIIFCLWKRAKFPLSHRTVSNTVNDLKTYTEPDDYNSAYQDDSSTIKCPHSQTKQSKTIKPHIKMLLYLKKHERNRDPDEDENVTNLADKKNKKGKGMKTKPRQSDVQTLNVQHDSSLIYVNKTFCDLSRDGVSLNTAGHLYDHLTIMTKDTKSDDGSYLKPTCSTVDIERDEYGRNGSHGTSTSNLPSCDPVVDARQELVEIVDCKVDHSFGKSNPSNPSRLVAHYIEIDSNLKLNH